MPSGGQKGGDQCGDIREVESSKPVLSQMIYNGTDDPTYVTLTAGQKLAIGYWKSPLCTGTVIAPGWVLTAKHCQTEAPLTKFCIGVSQTAPGQCFDVIRNIEAPTYNFLGEPIELDLVLTELEGYNADSEDVKPIPLVTQPLAFFVGADAEASGYGLQEKGDIGEQKFLSARIESVAPPSDGAQFIRIFGNGEKGVCGGDSGGPLMVVDSTGVVRVAGALKGGDTTCTGYDRYTRVDFMKDWIETYTGVTPNPNGPPGCGDVTEEGLCTGGRALYCLGNRLWADACPNTCGYDESESAYRCIEGSDPCRGVDALGSCDRNSAVWCESGVVKRRNCECETSTCVDDPKVGAYCE